MWWCSQSNLPVAAPVMLNFMPSWWAREYGLALGERLFLDAEYRAATVREMHRRLGISHSDSMVCCPQKYRIAAHYRC